MGKDMITQEGIMNVLDICYEKCVNGIPNVSDSVTDLAQDYLERYDDKEKACQALIRNQLMKCGTSGFITVFGGFITLPVTLPEMLPVCYTCKCE